MPENDSPTAPSAEIDPLVFDRLSNNQRNVLGNIAIGLDGGHNYATIRSLEQRGLIDSYREYRGGRFPVMLTRYSVPIAVHMAWCLWCANHAGDDEQADASASAGSLSKSHPNGGRVESNINERHELPRAPDQEPTP